jgi:hypothetical protein
MITPYDAVFRAALDSATNQSATLRFGDVTAVNGNRLTVDVGGSSVPNIPIMRPFGVPTPTVNVGDRVWLLHQGSLMVCIGTTA